MIQSVNSFKTISYFIIFALMSFLAMAKNQATAASEYVVLDVDKQKIQDLTLYLEIAQSELSRQTHAKDSAQLELKKYRNHFSLIFKAQHQYSVEMLKEIEAINHPLYQHYLKKHNNVFKSSDALIFSDYPNLQKIFKERNQLIIAILKDLNQKKHANNQRNIKLEQELEQQSNQISKEMNLSMLSNQKIEAQDFVNIELFQAQNNIKTLQTKMQLLQVQQSNKLNYLKSELLNANETIDIISNNLNTVEEKNQQIKTKKSAKIEAIKQQLANSNKVIANQKQKELKNKKDLIFAHKAIDTLSISLQAVKLEKIQEQINQADKFEALLAENQKIKKNAILANKYVKLADDKAQQQTELNQSKFLMFEQAVGQAESDVAIAQQNQQITQEELKQARDSIDILSENLETSKDTNTKTQAINLAKFNKYQQDLLLANQKNKDYLLQLNATTKDSKECRENLKIAKQNITLINDKIQQKSDNKTKIQ